MPNNYETIIFETSEQIATISLNRPDVRNAFNDKLINELIDVLEKIKADKEIRVLVLKGKGKSFCAGADLNWMKSMKNASYEDNIKDSKRLSEMFHVLYSLPIPTIAMVNGAAVGGGVGLVAACDIVIASTKAIFSLSEVRIGLVPACISPYIIKRVNPGHLKAFFLTGKRFSAEVADIIGLVNLICAPEALENETEKIIKAVMRCGPQALQMAKELLINIPNMKPEEYIDYTSEMIAKLRVSEEGQEGLSSFLEKREPNWAR